MTTYIENRTLIKGIGWKTSFEAFTNRKLIAVYIHPFGYKVYMFRHNIPRL